MTKRDIKYFGKAKELAERSCFPKMNLGCVAVIKNKTLATGCNVYKTHPKQKEYNKFRPMIIETGSVVGLHTMHAEFNCLISIMDEDIQWDKVELYIYRRKVEKPFGMARPCAACMQMIKELGIKKIHYTTEDGFAYEHLTHNLLETSA